MLNEMTTIEVNETWELVEASANYCSINLKWVFKMKKDTTGNITKHKVQLVAKSYVHQQHGVDFDEVFALMA
jgi:ribosome-associated toxin RatA of RatAB toxin-antitoxin module